MNDEREPVRIREADGLADATARPLAVLYKHSPFCGASRAAAMEIRRFMADHPHVPVFMVDVVEDRSFARDIARALEVRHESPQVIVLRDGRPVWDASHAAVSAGALSRETGTPGA